VPFLFLQNLESISIHDKTDLINVLWTVSVEFQFYFIAPFLIKFVSEKGILYYALPIAILFFILKCMILYSWRSEVEMLWRFPYISIIGRFNQFLSGVVIAFYWKRINSAKVKKRLGILAISLGLIIIAVLCDVLNSEGGGEHVWQWWRIFQIDIEAIGWGIFIIGYLLLDPLRWSRRLQKILSSFGVISFSFYLLHWAVLNDIITSFPIFGVQYPKHIISYMLYGTFLFLPATILLSSLSYWCIERPFLSLRSVYVVDDKKIEN
jgi:peptidoglycan/LPS O-acetylase OafA/YrhL